MTTFAFVLVIGIGLLTLQTASLGFLVPSEYKPDLIVAMVVWAALRLEITSGLCVAFTSGLVVDVLSSSPLGLFAVLYSFVFIMCRQLNAAFHIDGPVGRGAVVAGSTVVIGLLVQFVRLFSGLSGFGWSSIAWVLGKSAISGIASILVIFMVDRLYDSLSRIANPQ